MVKSKKKATEEVAQEEQVVTEEVVAETPAEPTEEPTSEPTSESTEEVAAEPAKKAVPKEAKNPKKAAHSLKHTESVALVDKNKTYPLAEALELVKKTSYTKFDGSVDVHVHLTTAKKTEDSVRGMVTLPHGTGRERKIAIITDEMIEKIEKGWMDFDVAIATPDMMPKLAKLAKILGPKGLMPNPKSGTVTTEPAKVAEELKGGKIEYKADTLNNIHQTIGKVSWDNQKLTENFEALVGALPKGRIKSVTLAPTMGSSVKIAF